MSSKLFSVALALLFLFMANDAFAKTLKKEKVVRKISSISELKLPTNFCTDPHKIDKRATSCEDNDHFVAAAEYCLEMLDHQADRVIAYYTPEGHEAQEFDDEESLHGVATPGFDYLIELNKKIFNEIDAYKHFFALPEDSDDHEISGGDEERYAMGISCYGDNVNDLNGVMDDVKDDLDMLEKLRHAVHEREETHKSSPQIE